MIKISDIEKCYHTDEVDIVALNKMSIEVDEGEFVAIMGPSGCGKSTLLNILGFLDDPDSGSYVFNGVEVTSCNERKRADLRKQNVGFLFQNFNLIDDLTIFENVELPMIYTGLPTSVRAKRTEEVLDKMHIDKRKKPIRSNYLAVSSNALHWHGRWGTGLN
jgi:putative ABC transport system ATP-binding protein